MKKIALSKILCTVVLSLIIVFSITGCKNTATDVPEPTLPAVTEAPTVISTTAPERIVLVDPFALASEQVSAFLNEYATANNLLFTSWPSLEGDYSGVRIIVLFASSDALVSAASANPQTQFVVISNLDVPLIGNVSAIQPDAVQLTFMAGYMTMLAAEDWRAGAFLVDDASLGLADAFSNGGKYFCGFCSPVYPPYKSFPVSVALTSGSSIDDWNLQAAALNEIVVNSLYVDRLGDTPELLDQFPSSVFFTSNLTSANEQRYAAVLGADALIGLQQLLPEVLTGQGGKTVIAKPAILKINNSEMVSPGKVDLFNSVSQELSDGLISPLSVQ